MKIWTWLCKPVAPALKKNQDRMDGPPGQQSSSRFSERRCQSNWLVFFVVATSLYLCLKSAQENKEKVRVIFGHSHTPVHPYTYVCLSSFPSFFFNFNFNFFETGSCSTAQANLELFIPGWSWTQHSNAEFVPPDQVLRHTLFHATSCPPLTCLPHPQL